MTNRSLLLHRSAIGLLLATLVLLSVRLGLSEMRYRDMERLNQKLQLQAAQREDHLREQERIIAHLRQTKAELEAEAGR